MYHVRWGGKRERERSFMKVKEMRDVPVLNEEGVGTSDKNVKD